MLEAGQIFASRYRIRQRIAEGGMGAIFEAEHTGTERRVALKLLFPHIMSVASAREKFELEAKVAARVNSPHIVQVLDAGFDEPSQSPYLVMELLEGETLAALVKTRGALPAREVVELMRQVAAGLDAAHGYRDAKGVRMPIIHRDLKPDNLFVAREPDGSAKVKILDFGIAKVLSDTRNVSQEVRGTPLYMAYEQVTADRLSPATDVWALGLITYYALTGARYWRSAQADGAGVQSLFAEILTLPLEPPSERIRQQGLSAAFGEGFDAWLLQCINRDPSRRFPSAGEAIEALARALQQPPVAVRAPAPAAAPSAAPGMRTATFPATPAGVIHAGTAPSLSAVASERAVTAKLRTRPVVLGGATAGVVLVVALAAAWMSGSDEPERAGAALTPAPAKEAALREPPDGDDPDSRSAADTAARAPIVAPVRVAPVHAADAGREERRDHPVPTWPPQGLETPAPGPEPSKPAQAEDARPSPVRESPRQPSSSALSPAQPLPRSSPPQPALTPPPDKTEKPATPATKPRRPSKIDPYDDW